MAHRHPEARRRREDGRRGADWRRRRVGRPGLRLGRIVRVPPAGAAIVGGGPVEGDPAPTRCDTVCRVEATCHNKLITAGGEGSRQREDCLDEVLVPFWGANHSIRTVVVLSAQARTVHSQGSDYPRPGTGAWVPYLTAERSTPCGRTVRACAGGGEGRRRCLDLAPGRDPVREERS